MKSDKEAIDEIAGAFFGAFANGSGTPESIDVLYDIFIPEAIVVKNVGGTTEVLSVSGFVEPRRAILSDGSLQDFREYEVCEKTDIFANIGQRFSRYEKSWSASGRSFSGSGVKSLQFVRTSRGWKISGLVWDDA